MGLWKAALRGACGCITVTVVLVAPVSAASAQTWVGGWATALDEVYHPPASQPRMFVNSSAQNQTLRMIVHLSQGGNQLRIHLRNTFGSTPLSIGSVAVGEQRSGAALVPGSVHIVRFGGKASVTVPVRSEVVSDPIGFVTAPQENLAISVYVTKSGPITAHWESYTRSYIAPANTGDHVGDTAVTPFTGTTTSWLLVDAVDVRIPAAAGDGTIVALGDSLTDGRGSTLGGNDRWSDDLARRLSGSGKEVVNEGLGGNRILSGPTPALQRLTTDVFDRPDVRDLIVFEGVNDIGSGSASTSQVEAGLSRIVSEAHARGIRVIGATITPYLGSRVYTCCEAIREAVNNWILTSGTFDAVLDFDSIVRDPSNPTIVNPIYDGGDHIHLKPSGYAALANSIPLSDF